MTMYSFLNILNFHFFMISIKVWPSFVANCFVYEKVMVLMNKSVFVALKQSDIPCCGVQYIV